MSSSSRPIVLSIAGSDPSGGAGIQADLKTFSALGVYGAAVLTALTAQNTRGVFGLHQVPAPFLRAQCDAVLSDLEVDAVKIGMLGDRDAITTVAEILSRYRPHFVVLDPVMISTSGDRLIDRDAEIELRRSLLPLADLCTPNLAEAAVLVGRPQAETEVEMLGQAEEIRSLGASAVLLKGGHGEGSEASDLLVHSGGSRWFRRSRVKTVNTHGTGCTLSSAIAAFSALGEDLEEATRRAKDYLHRALEAADALAIGLGHGPVDHLALAPDGHPPPVD